MALDFSEAEEKLPLESIYSLDYTRTPWPFRRERIAQFSKWWTTKPGTAVRLMYAAHLHALSRGRDLGLVEAKSKIIDHVGTFGMSLAAVPGATLREGVASLRGEGYYQTQPPPQLYMFDIKANAIALENYLANQGG